MFKKIKKYIIILTVFVCVICSNGCSSTNITFDANKFIMYVVKEGINTDTSSGGNISSTLNNKQNTYLERLESIKNNISDTIYDTFTNNLKSNIKTYSDFFNSSDTITYTNLNVPSEINNNIAWAMSPSILIKLHNACSILLSYHNLQQNKNNLKGDDHFCTDFYTTLHKTTDIGNNSEYYQAAPYMGNVVDSTTKAELKAIYGDEYEKMYLEDASIFPHNYYEDTNSFASYCGVAKNTLSNWLNNINLENQKILKSNNDIDYTKAEPEHFLYSYLKKPSEAPASEYDFLLKASTGSGVLKKEIYSATRQVSVSSGDSDSDTEAQTNGADQAFELANKALESKHCGIKATGEKNENTVYAQLSKVGMYCNYLGKVCNLLAYYTRLDSVQEPETEGGSTIYTCTLKVYVIYDFPELYEYHYENMNGAQFVSTVDTNGTNVNASYIVALKQISCNNVVNSAPFLIDDTTVQTKLDQKSDLAGMSTMQTKISDTATGNEDITASVYEINWVNPDLASSVVNNLQTYKQYQDAQLGADQLGKVGRQILDTGFFKAKSTLETDNMFEPTTCELAKSFFNFENIFQTMLSGQTTGYNAMGEDLVIIIANIPVMALRLNELKEDAQGIMQDAVNQSEDNGYTKIYVTPKDNGTGTPQQTVIKTWVEIKAINNINGAGFDTQNTGLVYDLMENKIFKRKDSSDPSESAIDQVKDSDRENYILPDYDVNNAFFRNEPGTVTLLKYYPVYQEEDIAEGQYFPLGRSLYINKSNISYLGDGEYKFSNSQRPFAYMSSATTNKLDSSQASLGLNLGAIKNWDDDTIISGYEKYTGKKISESSNSSSNSSSSSNSNNIVQESQIQSIIKAMTTKYKNESYMTKGADGKYHEKGITLPYNNNQSKGGNSCTGYAVHLLKQYAHVCDSNIVEASFTNYRYTTQALVESGVSDSVLNVMNMSNYWSKINVNKLGGNIDNLKPGSIILYGQRSGEDYLGHAIIYVGKNGDKYTFTDFSSNNLGYFNVDKDEVEVETNCIHFTSSGVSSAGSTNKYTIIIQPIS